jgi:hypothetical protein
MKEIAPERQQLIERYQPNGYTFVTFLNPLLDEESPFIAEYMDRKNYLVVNINTNTPNWEVIVFRKPGQVESLIHSALTHIRKRT